MVYFSMMRINKIRTIIFLDVSINQYRQDRNPNNSSIPMEHKAFKYQH